MCGPHNTCFFSIEERGFIMKVFDLQGKQTNFISEILAGITTFITMSYLLVICPDMIDGKGAAGTTIYIGLCITCFIGCLAMGFWAKQPFVVGPSVGLTAFFGATLLTDLKHDFHQALAIVFFAGLIYLLLSITGLANKLFSSLSGGMKNGISAGLGLYIAMIGLRNSGFLSGGDGGSWQIAELSHYNDIHFFTIMVMFAGLICIAVFKRIGLPLPPLLGLIASGIFYYAGGLWFGFLDKKTIIPQLGGINHNFGSWYEEAFLKNVTDGVVSLFKGMSFDVKSILVLVVSIMVCALFNTTESVGVVYAIAKNNGQLDDGGNFGSLKSTLGSNSAATTIGSLIGAPMVSVAPESAAGICAQGKSGLTAVTTGIFFLLAAFFVPVAKIIPSAVTACVMVYIGATMLGSVKDVDFSDLGESIPAIVTMILIPFTSSIIDGIALGVILHIVINLLLFKIKAVKPIEMIVAVFFGLYYFMV